MSDKVPEQSRIIDRPGMRTGLKIVVIATLLLVLLIPLQMVRSVVSERQIRSTAVTNETIDMHGGRQRLVGTFLVIPVTVTEQIDEDRTRERQDEVYVPADQLVTNVTLRPEELHRGIYRIPVYTAAIAMSGTFAVPQAIIAELSDDFAGTARFRLDEAQLAITVADMRGLRQAPTATWDGSSQAAVATVVGDGYAGRGIAFAAPGVAPGSRHTFSLELGLTGGGSFGVVPVAMDSEVTVSSVWPSPSFAGELLPTQRSVSDDGFDATWNVSGLGQGLREAFSSSGAINSAAGLQIGLFMPVDHYQKATRSVKYGALFLLLPFVALFLIEVFSGARLHPIQYLLVGAAKIVFYLLDLSLSEHLGFTAAYVIGAAATITLICIYARSAFRSLSHAMMLGGLLVGEYVFLYTALASEDYALLIGSIGLFVLLGIVMLATRRIDWYRVV